MRKQAQSFENYRLNAQKQYLKKQKNKNKKTQT